MIEVSPVALFTLGFVTFILGIVASDVLLKLIVQRLHWRITYEAGCEKCNRPAGVFINRNAECLDCIFLENDRKQAAFAQEVVRAQEIIRLEKIEESDDDDG